MSLWNHYPKGAATKIEARAKGWLILEDGSFMAPADRDAAIERMLPRLRRFADTALAGRVVTDYELREIATSLLDAAGGDR